MAFGDVSFQKTSWAWKISITDRQRLELQLERKEHRYLAYFENDVCSKRNSDRGAAGENLGTATESTMRLVKHPFGNSRLPLR